MTTDLGHADRRVGPVRPPARDASRSPSRRAGRSPTPSCARTSATPPARSAPSAPGSSRRSTTGRSCAAPARAIKADVDGAAAGAARAVRGGGDRPRRRRALGARRRGGQPDRRRPGAGDRARDEVVKVKSMATQETGLNEALGEAGIAALETDLAELIVQLSDDRPSHFLVPGHPPQPLGDPRHLPARDARRGPGPHRRAAAAGHGGARAPAPEVPLRAGGHLRGQLRGRRHRDDLGRRVRGQRADVPDAAGHADHGDGRREARPHVVGPRGVPAAAAALVHRGADEPVHVDVERGDARRRAADLPPRAARQRPLERPRLARRPRRRCTASAARRASTSARSTSARAGTPTARSTRGRSAPC